MDASSRLRKEVITLFDVCCEVRWRANEERPVVEVLYPTEFNDEYVLKSIRQFSFPCGREENTSLDEVDAVQLFTFVLTDATSNYTFGYARFTPGTSNCLCILTGLTWHDLFYKFLNHLSTVSKNGTRADVESMLTNAYHVDIPAPGTKLQLTECTPLGRFSESVPDPEKLPTLKSDKYMLEFYNAVNEKQMIQIYAALLKERRILFTGRKLSQLSSCVFAASKLLRPFHWQNLFIPVLSRDLTDFLMAPMPYLIGIPKKTFLGVTNRHDHYGEVVVMDLDQKTFDSPFTDALPPDVNQFLRSRLKSSSDMFLSDGLARSFLQANAILFGKYTSGFVRNETTGLYEWNRMGFVEKQKASAQPFLTAAIGHDGVQYFERFIEERLRALNANCPIAGEFEREIASLDPKYFSENRGPGGLLLPTLPTKPPEVLQHAVSRMQENAGEVLTELKDRVQAISLKDTFGRLTPRSREVRRRRLKKKKQPTAAIDPLCIDTSVYDFNNPLAKDPLGPSCAGYEQQAGVDRNNGDASQSVSDSESVKSAGDLIDFSDDAAVALPYLSATRDRTTTSGQPTSLAEALLNPTTSSQLNSCQQLQTRNPISTHQQDWSAFETPQPIKLDNSLRSLGGTSLGVRARSSDRTKASSSRMEKWEKFE